MLINKNFFSTSITLEYELSHPETVTIIFYNQIDELTDIIEQKQLAGTQRMVWNPVLPGGVYYFRLHAGEQVVTGKVVKMR